MFATAALLLSLTSWAMLRYSLDTTLHQDLEERVDDVRTQLHLFTHVPSDEPMQGRFDAIYRFRDDGKWLQILDENGHWIYRSQRMIAEDAPLALPKALEHAADISEFHQGSRFVRTFSKTISVDGHAYSVDVGASLNKQQALLRRFGLELLILTPLVLLAAVAAGHHMSRKALDPVMLIALEARRISDRNLDQRLPVSPTDDEISHLSRTLNKMLARIDAGYRSVRDFTANASHELRTPLARLRTEVEVALLTPRSSEEYQDTLIHVQDSAEEMTRLTENLLTLARADADSVSLTLRPVDLWELVSAECAEWSGIAGHLHLTLVKKLLAPEGSAGNAQVFVLGDRASLLRLIRILLDNACKFTPAGGTITVTVELTPRVATFVVEDTGIGITPQQQKRVFERFYRVKGDQADHHAGSGLGLSLAAWIAEQHRTSIELKSETGSGTRFSMELQRVQSESVAPESPKKGTSILAKK
jgi:signal transduction histidine kinase